MPRRLFCSSLLLAAILAGGVWAQVDPDPDGIGLYADPGASLSSVQASTGSQVQIYLVLTRPSGSVGISSWECGVEVPDNAIVMGWTIPSQHVNIGSGNEFAVSYLDDLPIGDVVLLAMGTIIAGGSQPGSFYITPGLADSGHDGLPNYLDGAGSLLAMTPYPAGVSYPTFMLNGTMGEEEDTTWGNVKSLYRN